MTDNERRRAIWQLMGEICDLRNTISYVENRILKKQIAVQELMTGIDFEGATEIPTPPATEPIAPIGYMVRSVMTQINGDVFDTKLLKALILKRFPNAKRNLRRVYSVTDYMLKKGEIERTPGGFRRKSIQLA